MKKIIFYYHHFGGLGHGTRIKNMCAVLKKNNPKFDIYIVNSGKPQKELGLEKYGKVLNLPPLTSNHGLFGVDLKNIDSSFFLKREYMLLKISQRIKPDIVIFEHFPFGRDYLDKEIIKWILTLKKNNCKIYSSVRDIITQDINKNRFNKIMDYFNGIFVHSDEKHSFFPIKFYQDIKSKMIFTGRIFPVKDFSKVNFFDEFNFINLSKVNKKIVISVGGGIDGINIISKIIEIARLPKNINDAFVVFVGLSFSDKKYYEMLDKIKNENLNNIFLKKFDLNYLSYLKQSDFVISMAGYNSFNDYLLYKKPTIFVPRKTDDEQIVRLNKYGLKDCVCMDLNKLSDIIDDYKSGKLKLERISYNLNKNDIDSLFSVLNSVNEFKSLKIRLTNRCNSNCLMCSWIKDPIKKSLDYNKVIKIIDQAKISGIDVINFTGGEPLIYDRLLDLLKYVKEKKMKLSLSTNLICNKSEFDKIINEVDFLDFSLDTLSKIKYSRIRGVDGFDKVIKNLKNIPKKVKTHMNVTIMKSNLIEMLKLLKFAKNNNINSISFGQIAVSDYNVEIIKNELISIDEMRNFYFEIYPLLLKESDDEISLSISPKILELEGLSDRAKVLKLLFLKNQIYDKTVENIFKLYSKNILDTKKSIGDNLEDLQLVSRDSLRINIEGNYSVCCFLDENKEYSIENMTISEYISNIRKNKIEYKQCEKCVQKCKLKKNQNNIKYKY